MKTTDTDIKLLTLRTVVTTTDTGISLARRLQNMKTDLRSQVIRMGGEWFDNSMSYDVEPISGTDSYRIKVMATYYGEASKQQSS